MIRWLYVAGIVFAATFLSACSGQEKSSAKHSVTYGLTLAPSGFDPHINQAAEIGIVLRQVYDTLVYRDPNTNEIVPGLATAWTISNDGLEYTFTLRQGVTFHDGTAFNARAVAANLDRITDPATASQKAVYLLGPYAGYEVVDDYTIRIRLTEPYSPLLDSLAQVYLGIASPTALAQYSLNRYQFHQVGTGPFTFVDYVPEDRIVLRRNPIYNWGPAFYQPADEHSVDEIVFRYFVDPAGRSLALEGGKTQAVGELLPTDARVLVGNSSIRVTPIEVPGQPLQFIMNTSRFPTDNATVRQALLYATNRNAIVDAIFQGFSPVAWGPLSAATLYYDRELKGVYALDTGQAQSLLSSVGYQDSDHNGYLDFGGVELEVTMIVPPWGLIPDVAQLLQDQWRTIGVRVKLDPVSSFPALLDEVAAGEYNLVAYYAFGLDPAFLSIYYASDGANNWTGYSSVELDNVLHEAARQTDSGVRLNLYVQAQRIIMQQALVLPIRDYVNLNGSSTTLDGLEFDPYGWNPLLNNLRVADQ